MQKAWVLCPFIVPVLITIYAIFLPKKGWEKFTNTHDYILKDSQTPFLSIKSINVTLHIQEETNYRAEQRKLP